MIEVSAHIEEWKTIIPFKIAGLCREVFRFVVVEISDGYQRGSAEGLPVHYLGETAELLVEQLCRIAGDIKSGLDRAHLRSAMPAGGARNAIDNALWDLDAKRAGKRVWEFLDIQPKPVTSAFTIGIERDVATMARRAREAAEYGLLKIKVDADCPAERVAAIREARPDARLIVDANQAWDFQTLRAQAPRLADLGVELIEQPLARGADEALEIYNSPIPLCADESCQHTGELAQAAERYQIINIKLDKAGGMTEALDLVRGVRAAGLKVLLSNMGGTSLAMAPAFVVAQLCDYVELDGPLLLRQDRNSSMICGGGVMGVPAANLWG